MANFSKQFLSQSVNGASIPITLTGILPSISGTLVHTAVAGTASMDEIYLYFSNSAISDGIVITTFGAVTTGNSFYTVVPAQGGRVLSCDGRLLQNSLPVSCLASGANSIASSGISVDGFINRLS